MFLNAFFYLFLEDMFSCHRHEMEKSHLAELDRKRHSTDSLTNISTSSFCLFLTFTDAKDESFRGNGLQSEQTVDANMVTDRAAGRDKSLMTP